MEPEVIKAGMKPKPRPTGIFSRPLSEALQGIQLEKPEFVEITFPTYPSTAAVRDVGPTC